MMQFDLRHFSKRYAVPAILLLLGTATFWLKEIRVSSDLAWHMNIALNFFKGSNPYEMTNFLGPVFNKGPVWPFLLCISYYLFGASPESAFVVIKVFAVANPIIIYYLGKNLFDRKTGFAAALLILSSYSVNFWSYRHLDAVWPFFAIAAILSINIAFDKKQISYFFLASVCISIAYLVKQAAFLIMPLPFILFCVIKDFRLKKVFWGLVVYAIAILLLTVPWASYVYTQTQDMRIALFGSGSGPAAEYANMNVLDLIKQFISGLLFYYNRGSNSLSANFVLAPLFIVAWLFLFYKALRGNKSSILLATILMLILPYASVVGNNNLRLGQLIFVFLMSYLVLTSFLKLIADYLVKTSKIKYEDSLATILFFIVIFVLILIQFFYRSNNNNRNYDFFKQSYLYELIQNRSLPQQKMSWKYGATEVMVGEWIKNNIPEGSKFITAKASEGKAIYFSAQGKIDMYDMPMSYFTTKYKFEGEIPNGKVIFLSSWSARVDPKNYFISLTDYNLNQFVKSNQIDYILVGRRNNYLTQYFGANSCYVKIAEFGKGAYKIYKILEVDNTTNVTPMISDYAVLYLKHLLEENQFMFDVYVKKFFLPFLGRDKDEVEKLTLLHEQDSSSEYFYVRNGKIY